MIIPLSILCLLGICLDILIFASPAKPSTHPGPSAEVPGGLAAISGVTDSPGFFVDGNGTGEPRPFRAETTEGTIDQGEFAIATLVFDFPDRAIKPTLEHEASYRLSAGSIHHTGGP